LPNTAEAYGSSIPFEIRDDLKSIMSYTSKTGKEASITVCQHPNADKVFVAGYSKGNRYSTEVMPCQKKFGTSEQIGTVHTHPADARAIGIKPSDSDLTINLDDSLKHARRQVDCILNSWSPYIHCFEPKQIPEKEVLRKYAHATETAPGVYSSPYIVDNVGRDFLHSWYDRKTWQRVKDPDPNTVTKCAIGRAGRFVRKKVKEMERGPFCDLVQDLTQPQDNRVGERCRVELRTRKILGVPYEKYLDRESRTNHT